MIEQALGGACAVFFAGMGLAAIARPGFVVGFFGIELKTYAGRSEVRAVYGGFGLAVAALIAFAVAAPSAISAGILLAIGISVGGMAAGRLLGGFLERRMPLGWVGVFLAVEVALSAALLSSASLVAAASARPAPCAAEPAGPGCT